MIDADVEGGVVRGGEDGVEEEDGAEEDGAAGRTTSLK